MTWALHNTSTRTSLLWWPKRHDIIQCTLGAVPFRLNSGLHAYNVTEAGVSCSSSLMYTDKKEEACPAVEVLAYAHIAGDDYYLGHKVFSMSLRFEVAVSSNHLSTYTWTLACTLLALYMLSKHWWRNVSQNLDYVQWTAVRYQINLIMLCKFWNSANTALQSSASLISSPGFSVPSPSPILQFSGGRSAVWLSTGLCKATHSEALTVSGITKTSILPANSSLCNFKGYYSKCYPIKWFITGCRGMVLGRGGGGVGSR